MNLPKTRADLISAAALAGRDPLCPPGRAGRWFVAVPAAGGGVQIIDYRGRDAEGLSAAALALWSRLYAEARRDVLDEAGFACAPAGRRSSARRPQPVNPAAVVEPDVPEAGPGEVRP